MPWEAPVTIAVFVASDMAPSRNQASDPDTGQRKPIWLHSRWSGNQSQAVRALHPARTMITRSVRTAKQAHELDFIGGHLAIDFVNTVRVVNGEGTDTLGSDGAVRVWRGLAGVPGATKPAAWPAGATLEAPRPLREAAGKAIEAKKAGGRPPL